MPQEKTQRLLDEDSQLLNSTIVSEIFPYAKWVLILSIFGRLIIILISIKKVSICKVNFYYELLVYVVMFCLPQGADLDIDIILYLSSTLLNFILNGFHFWCGLAATLVVQICFFASRVAFYNDTFDDKLVMVCIFNMMW